MSMQANSQERAWGRLPGRLRGMTLARLTDQLAERPWALAFCSFAVTALIIRPDQLSF